MNILLTSLGIPGWDLSFDDVQQSRRPCVYAWIRGDEVLYVGKGESGLERPISSTHHRTSHMEPGDRLLVWTTASRSLALITEAKLISGIKPRFNGHNGRGILGKTPELIRIEKARRILQLRKERDQLQAETVNLRKTIGSLQDITDPQLKRIATLEGQLTKAQKKITFLNSRTLSSFNHK